MRPWTSLLLFVALSTAQLTSASQSQDMLAYRALVQQDLRLASVGYLLAKASAPFCKRKSRNPGWVLHDKAQYPDPDIAQAAFGFRAAVALSAVVPGSTAEAIGLKPGDGIIAVNDLTVSGLPFAKNKRASARLETVQNILSDAFDASDPVKITLETANGREQFAINPAAICASRFWVDTKSRLDAGADGVSVRVTEGLLDFTEKNDSELAAIVAHEMSHNLLGHRQRLATSGKSNKEILATEIEADRLSVWLMANAGYDTAAALRFAERYGRKSGLGIFSAGTHLRWKNRQRVMQLEIARIASVPAEHGLRPPPLLMTSE